MNPLEVAVLVISLIAIIPFGIITSYQDIKRNKIKNKFIVIVLIFALIINICIVGYLFYTNDNIKWLYVKEYLLNIVFAFFVGLLIWEGSLWSAGDAKLFLAYAAIVPLIIYQWGYVNNFPSFVILVNTFTPYFIFYFGYMLFRTSLKDKVEVFKEMLNPKMMFSFIIFIFSFSWIAQLIFGLLNIQVNFFVSVFVLFLMMVVLTKFLRVSLTIAGLVISMLRLIFDYRTVFTTVFLKQFLFMLFLFIFIIYLVINLGFKFFAKPIYVEDLKPGMILAEDIYKEKDKEEYKKRKIVPISFITTLFDKVQFQSILSQLPEGLTKDEVEKIKKLHSQGKFKEHVVMINYTIPFAPFMFFGVLITILAQGNAFMFIRAVLENFI